MSATLMEQGRVRVGEGGRVIIPASYRKILSVKPGDELMIRIEDGELRLFRQQEAVDRLRKAVKRTRPAGSATDDFLAFRKHDSGDA